MVVTDSLRGLEFQRRQLCLRPARGASFWKRQLASDNPADTVSVIVRVQQEREREREGGGGGWRGRGEGALKKEKRKKSTNIDFDLYLDSL